MKSICIRFITIFICDFGNEMAMKNSPPGAQKCTHGGEMFCINEFNRLLKCLNSVIIILESRLGHIVPVNCIWAFHGHHLLTLV